MGGTTSKYGVSGLGGQRGRVMSMALDRVRDEGIPMGEALQESWQFVANEAMGVEQPDRFQATQAPASAPAPTPAPTPAQKVPASEFSPTNVYYDVGRDDGGERGREALKAVLQQYDVAELHEIIKRQAMDAPGRTRKWKDANRLREHILIKAHARAMQGWVFRHYEG